MKRVEKILVRTHITFRNVRTEKRLNEDRAVVGNLIDQGQTLRLEGVQTLVISAGSLPNDGLWKAIRKEVKEIYSIGECYSPRRLQRSSIDGLMVGLKV